MDRRSFSRFRLGCLALGIGSFSYFANAYKGATEGIKISCAHELTAVLPFDPVSLEHDLGDVGNHFVTSKAVERVSISNLISHDEAVGLWNRISDFIDREYSPSARTAKELKFISKPDKSGNLIWGLTRSDDVKPNNDFFAIPALRKALVPANAAVAKILAELNSKVRTGHYELNFAQVIWGCKTSEAFFSNPNHYHAQEVSVAVNLLGNGTVFTDSMRSINEGDAIIFSDEKHFSNPAPSDQKLFLGLALKFVPNAHQ